MLGVALRPLFASAAGGAIVAFAASSAYAQDFSEFSRARDVAREAARARAAVIDRVRPPRVAGPRAPRSVERNAAVRTPSPSTVAPVSAARSAPAQLPDAPLVLVVSLEQQRLSVYSQGKLIETTKVSTGTASDPTPSGVFAVIEKNEKHFSNLFGGAPMPFMQRLTMSGVALHSGYVTGRPASHGCVRLPHEYARRLFKATKLGVRVIISGDDPRPVEIDTMRLFEPERIAAATRRAEAATDLSADKRSDSHPAAAADKSIDPRTGRPKGPLSLERDEVLRRAPVSILVSRADQKVYVRHMFEPVLEAPLAISEPRRPLGTHVYTLTDMRPDGSGQAWSALQVKLVPRRAAAVQVLAGKRSRAARALAQSRSEALPSEGVSSTSAEAVERFALPAEVLAQVAPLLRPGASLVVTDLPQSRRTQTGWTDIIVSP